jgi:hypothetical protein
MLPYKIQGPTERYYIDRRKRHVEELKIVNDFIESNKLDATITAATKTLKGINAIFNHNNCSGVSKLVSITRAKCGGSKVDMMKSCNALLRKINKDINHVDKCEKKRFYIDWDKIRNDGYDGVVFYEYSYKGSDTEEDDMSGFLGRWDSDTVVIWNWCFEDDIDVGQY